MRMLQDFAATLAPKNLLSSRGLVAVDSPSFLVEEGARDQKLSQTLISSQTVRKRTLMQELKRMIC
jgi:hypothetical protein